MARLKISRTDYAKLAQLINAAKEHSETIKVPKGHELDRTSTDYLWHLWHLAFSQARAKHSAGQTEDYHFFYDLYKYLNDDHIESALRAILK